MPSARVAPTRPKQHGGKSNEGQQAATISEVKRHSLARLQLTNTTKTLLNKTQRNTPTSCQRLPASSCTANRVKTAKGKGTGV